MSAESTTAVERPYKNVLFVGGAMRSGTTVLHRALCQARNSNPYISESWFIHDQFQIYDRGMARFEAQGLDQFRNTAAFVNLVRSNFETYLHEVSKRYGEPEVLVLKHPEVTKYFPLMRTMLPGMKFLVIVRDPRDVIGSMKAVNARLPSSGATNRLAGLATMNDYCAFYEQYYSKVIAQQEAFGADLSFLRYEDAVRDPARTFAFISSFSGLDFEGVDVTAFDPGSTETSYLSREARQKNALSGAFWSEGYAKALSPESIGTYAKRLSYLEIKDIEHLLESFGKAFDYW